MAPRIQKVLLLLTLCAALPVPPARAQQPVQDLRIDPLLLVSVKEFRNIVRTVGPEIYPSWHPLDVPLLLYRPRVQDVLLNATRRPPGFSSFTGRTVLGPERIYARNDSTVKDIDGQNTSMTLDSMRVLVVSDQYSRERQSIGSILARPTLAADWLRNWGFIQSPYDELGFLLHESFHVHQDSLAPDKNADERALTHYPLLDARNNALVALEARLLRQAVLAPDPAQRRARAAQFVAVRTLRRSYLDTAAVSYEDLNEFKEGTAYYVELRFFELADRVNPVPEMYLHNGFTGYRNVAGKLLRDALDDMVKIASFSDDRFGNRFGGGPARFRLYRTGAVQGLLLDELAPGWKQRIFSRGVYLSDLLAAAVGAADRRESLVAQAKAELGYDTVFANRQAMEAEGRRLIRERAEAITNSTQTVVEIRYGAVGDIAAMGYTPFGVTAVTDHSAIYDLVPIAAKFTNGVVLRMKSVVPVLIDREAKTLTFAVASPAAALEVKSGAPLDVPELTLSASPATTVLVSGKHVTIELH